MHPFVAPFAVFAAVDLGIVACAACLRTHVCRDRPLAFHALAIWALVVLAAHTTSRLGASRGAMLASMAIVPIAALAAARVPFRGATLWRDVWSQWREVSAVVAVLALQTALYLVPLLLAFDPQTLITGNFVCNDSVTHAVLMRGLPHDDPIVTSWRYLTYYPNGFHAVVFALSRAFPRVDAPSFLLPATIWGSSFLGLPMLLLAASAGVRSRVVAVLAAASPAAAFLLGTSVYLYFIGHMGALPFIAGAVIVTIAWTADDVRGLGLGLAAAPIAASAATYGIFPATIIGLAVALRVMIAARHPARALETLRAWLRVVVQPIALASLAAVAALSIAAVQQIAVGLSFFSAQALTTAGNLPGGYLSPFHVTGFWKSGIDYRLQLTGPDSAAGVILGGIFAVQVALVASARLPRTVGLPILVFAMPVVGTAIFGPGQYVNFKYLCLFSALWVTACSIALAQLAMRLPGGRAWPAAVGVSIVIAAMAITPLRSFRLLPALSEQWFQTLATLRSDHFASGPVLVLSNEDWFQYYRDVDDSVPLTPYYSLAYRGQPMREVIVDEAIRPSAAAFLDQTFNGGGHRLDVCASQTVGGRFRVYEFSCLARP